MKFRVFSIAEPRSSDTDIKKMPDEADADVLQVCDFQAQTFVFFNSEFCFAVII